ncbi:MAG: shikimate kinase [Nitrospirae bacterium RBG_13_43_8]|nr:MAG: shikimate kinase [Nitrospirae bacterium RBG_13_43_8]
MKNIVLTGFMGTGKTAVGRELSRLLNMKLVDVDTEIEKSRQMTINEIFKQFGELRFREIETEMIRKLSERKDVIISTGGGAVLRQENVDVLREQGIIVCLMATPETILKRTSHSSHRPLLQVEDPFGKIKELLDFRRPFYEKADIMIDTDCRTPRQIAEEIIDKMKDRA